MADTNLFIQIYNTINLHIAHKSMTQKLNSRLFMHSSCHKKSEKLIK